MSTALARSQNVTSPRVCLLDSSSAQGLFLGQTISGNRQKAVTEAGLREISPQDDDPSVERLLLAPDLVLTGLALKRMILAIQQHKAERDPASQSPLSLVPGGELGRVLARSTLGRQGPLVSWYPAGIPVESVQSTELATLEWSPREQLMDLGSLYHRGTSLKIPMTGDFVFPTAHWLQLLWANLLGAGPYLWGALLGSNLLSSSLRLIWASLRARSFSPYKVAPKLNRLGKNVRIHPSAVVEACCLADGVTIGANAVVRASILGEGVTVEDCAFVSVSCMGPRALAQRQSIVSYSLMGPESSCGGAIQLAVLDTGAAIKYGASLLDMNLGRLVRTRGLDGLLHEVPFGMAGVHVGANTLIGHGVTVAAGRSLPAGLSVINDPSTLLVRAEVPPGQGTYAVRNGRLELL